MEIYVNSSFSVDHYLTDHEEIHILVLVYLKWDSRQSPIQKKEDLGCVLSVTDRGTLACSSISTNIKIELWWQIHPLQGGLL